MVAQRRARRGTAWWPRPSRRRRRVRGTRPAPVHPAGAGCGCRPASPRSRTPTAAARGGRHLPRRHRGALRHPARERGGGTDRPAVPGQQHGRFTGRRAPRAGGCGRPGGCSPSPEAAGPSLMSTGTATVPDLRRPLRTRSPQLRAAPALRDGSARSPRTPTEHGGLGIRLEHPRGPLVLWIDLGAHRPFTDQDLTLLALLAGHLATGLSRAYQIDQQRETALALQRAILGPSAARGLRRTVRARGPPAGGRRRLVRHRPAARRADRHRGGRLRRPRLQPAAVMGQLRSACRALLLQDPRPDHARRARPLRRRPTGRDVHHRLLRRPRPRQRPPVVLERRAPARVLVRADGGAGRLLDEGRSCHWRYARQVPPLRVRRTRCRRTRPCCCTPTVWSSTAAAP